MSALADQTRPHRVEQSLGSQRSAVWSREAEARGGDPRQWKGDRPALQCRLAVSDSLLQYKPGFKGTYAAGCSHGFAVRADLSDPKQKKGKEDAFRDSVAWVKTHL